MSSSLINVVPEPTPPVAKSGTGFSLARAGEFAKFWVGLAGAVATTAIQVIPDVPRWLTIVSAFLTAVGVYIAKNSGQPDDSLEQSIQEAGQMSSATAATDGVGDPAHPASLDLPDAPVSPVITSSASQPPTS